MWISFLREMHLPPGVIEFWCFEEKYGLGIQGLVVEAEFIKFWPFRIHT
jgi:hypothetical protein